MALPDYPTQLEMDWPAERLGDPPPVHIPPGYTLRQYQPHDKAPYFALMEAVGWGRWDDDRLEPWLERIIPDGWFMIADRDDRFAASAMALHSHAPHHPFGGELGWVVTDPAHRGQGLGMAVCAAVVGRLIRGGYRNIHLYTEDFRLPALHVYFKLGFKPFLCADDMPARWRAVCEALQWPYTPERWRTL